MPEKPDNPSDEFGSAAHTSDTTRPKTGRIGRDELAEELDRRFREQHIDDAETAEEISVREMSVRALSACHQAGYAEGYTEAIRSVLMFLTVAVIVVGFLYRFYGAALNESK
jgi:hypothetical protein